MGLQGRGGTDKGGVGWGDWLERGDFGAGAGLKVRGGAHCWDEGLWAGLGR